MPISNARIGPYVPIPGTQTVLENRSDRTDYFVDTKLWRIHSVHMSMNWRPNPHAKKRHINVNGKSQGFSTNDTNLSSEPARTGLVRNKATSRADGLAPPEDPFGGLSAELDAWHHSWHDSQLRQQLGQAAHVQPLSDGGYAARQIDQVPSS